MSCQKTKSAIVIEADLEVANLAEINSNIIATNAAIGHNSFVESNILASLNLPISSSRKIGVSEIGIPETSFGKIGIFKDGGSKIDISKSTLSESSPSKIDPWHITSAETAFIHTDTDEFSEAQVTLIKPTNIKIGVGEVGFLVNSTSNDFTNPTGAARVSASEIFFSPSTLSNQFFSVHSSTPQIINNFNNTASNIWSEVSSTETHLNITLQIINLIALVASSALFYSDRLNYLSLQCDR